MNYYIADTHFGHKNIIMHDANDGCKQFSSIEEHDELIINNWNNRITSQDKIYILGDFSWLSNRGTEELIKKLNGIKFLIKGNHDRWCKDSACKKLFQEIYDYKAIIDGNNRVILFHYPIMFYQEQHKNSIHLYAHLHNSREEKLFYDACKNIANTTDIPMNCYNVGCMMPYMNYTPRTLEEIISGYNEYKKDRLYYIK